MKNKNMYSLISGIILILSCGYFFDNVKIYYFINKGNKYYYTKEYKKAKKYYEKAFFIKKSEVIKNNLIINDYEAKNYLEVLKRKGNKNFLNGNSFVKLSQNRNNKEKLKEALESYKKEMIKNSDMNIKKNYEIILKEVNKNKQKKDQQKEQKNENQENKDRKNKQNQSQKNKQKNQRQQKQDKKNDLNNNKQKKINQSQNNEDENREKEEINMVLKRLEGSEKQAFKNNERLINLTNNREENRW
ncbi:MAG: hypothetical protein Q7K48_04950 [Fusobacterium sp. JB021]|nr:hypothetical protein [Fusobacterium sp. JB021]